MIGRGTNGTAVLLLSRATINYLNLKKILKFLRRNERMSVDIFVGHDNIIIILYYRRIEFRIIIAIIVLIPKHNARHGIGARIGKNQAGACSKHANGLETAFRYSAVGKI